MLRNVKELQVMGMGNANFSSKPAMFQVDVVLVSQSQNQIIIKIERFH